MAKSVGIAVIHGIGSQDQHFAFESGKDYFWASLNNLKMHHLTLLCFYRFIAVTLTSLN